MKHNYRTWITINQSALLHNCKQLIQLIAPQKLALVIKGDAYGHGLGPIAQCAQQSQEIDVLCVAFLREAHKLCNNGITKQIIILCAIDDDLDARWCEQLIFLVDDLQTIQQLNTFAKEHNKVITVHLKVDIGLSRRGFLPSQLSQIAQQIKNYTYIRVTGLCSHLSSAKTNEQLTWQQAQNFENLVSQAKKIIALHDIHVTNSSSFFYHTPQATLTRIGLLAYGYWSLSQNTNKKIDLKPVLSWYTRVIHTKNLPTNIGIGYGHTFITKRPTRIALLPIGYADGYPQQLNNCGYVLVKNKIAPIIGVISMNLTIIDVTDIENVQINDHVTLIGKSLNAQKLAHISGITNVRQLLVAIDPTIQRIVID